MNNNEEKLCCGNCEYFIMVNNFGVVGKCQADNHELMYNWETCESHKQKEEKKDKTKFKSKYTRNILAQNKSDNSKWERLNKEPVELNDH